ncbi:MAG: hypothetical protein ABEH40_06970 [Haloferacaceae archaeon]
MAVDRERLSERLAAVERRLTDADPDGSGLADAAALEGRLSEVEGRVEALDERLGEVESGLQALRGYLGGVEAIDESVERRADAALAKAEELEARLAGDPDPRVEGSAAGGHDRDGGYDPDGGPAGGGAAADEGDRGRDDAGDGRGDDGRDRRLVGRLRDAL